MQHAIALGLSPNALLMIAVSTERNDMMQAIFKTLPEKKYSFTRAFSRASELRYSSVMELLIKLAPDDVQNMIKYDGYWAFKAAALNGHLHSGLGSKLPVLFEVKMVA